MTIQREKNGKGMQRNATQQKDTDDEGCLQILWNCDPSIEIVAEKPVKARLQTLTLINGTIFELFRVLVSNKGEQSHFSF